MAAFTELDNLAVNTLRALSVSPRRTPASRKALFLIFSFAQIDASFKAKSGHPGAPMGMAPMAHVLFSKMVRKQLCLPYARTTI